MRAYRWIKWRKLLIWLTALVFIGILLLAAGPTAWGIALNIATLLLQLLFAMMFMIIQFVALFWFLARGRMYWILPGETGATWDDYRGNPEIVENAKRIVILLKGVKEFKEMGGEAIRGLLLCGRASGSTDHWRHQSTRCTRPSVAPSWAFRPETMGGFA